MGAKPNRRAGGGILRLAQGEIIFIVLVASVVSSWPWFLLFYALGLLLMIVGLAFKQLVADDIQAIEAESVGMLDDLWESGGLLERVSRYRWIFALIGGAALALLWIFAGGGAITTMVAIFALLVAAMVLLSFWTILLPLWFALMTSSGFGLAASAENPRAPGTALIACFLAGVICDVLNHQLSKARDKGA